MESDTDKHTQEATEDGVIHQQKLGDSPEQVPPERLQRERGPEDTLIVDVQPPEL